MAEQALTACEKPSTFLGTCYFDCVVKQPKALILVY